MASAPSSPTRVRSRRSHHVSLYVTETPWSGGRADRALHQIDDLGRELGVFDQRREVAQHGLARRGEILGAGIVELHAVLLQHRAGFRLAVGGTLAVAGDVLGPQ